MESKVNTTNFRFGPLSKSAQQNCKIALLVDEKVAELHAPYIQHHFEGEMILTKGKSREEKERLEDLLFMKGFGRDSLFIGIGGGTTTDLVGFLASTYLRGVRLKLIPTTLLAMVDAAIGGKTGLDTPLMKNGIGSFYFPEEVCIDPFFLTTLPAHEILHGLAEVLKLGLCLDKKLWNALAKGVPKQEDLLPLIKAAAQAKLSIVKEDPYEKTGRRALLNFGHTVAHSLELFTQYAMPHGQAVAIGCVIESYFSVQMKLLSKKRQNEIVKRFKALGYDLKLPEGLSKAKLFQLMRRDKKNKSGTIRCILLDEIGSAAFGGAPSEIPQNLHYTQMN